MAVPEGLQDVAFLRGALAWRVDLLGESVQSLCCQASTQMTNQDCTQWMKIYGCNWEVDSFQKYSLYCLLGPETSIWPKKVLNGLNYQPQGAEHTYTCTTFSEHYQLERRSDSTFWHWWTMCVWTHFWTLILEKCPKCVHNVSKSRMCP